MHAAREEVSGGVSLVAGGIYRFKSRGGHRLRRLICWDGEHDELIFKDVAFKWNKNEKNAIALPRLAVLKLLQAGEATIEADCIRPAFMSSSDYELKRSSPKVDRTKRLKDLSDEERGSVVAKWMAKRDSDFELIAPLVGDASDASIEELLVAVYSPRRCARTISEYSKRAGVDSKAVKRLLHKFAWFGLDRNALLPLDVFRGRTGLLSRVNSKKPGRPSSAVKVFGEGCEGRPSNQEDVVRTLMALRECWVKQHKSLTDTYEFMKRAYYKRGNQYGSDFMIQGRLIPTMDMFRRIANILIQRHALRALREGAKGSKGLLEQRGRDTAIADDVLSVFDIDGTPFNRELVCRFKVDGESHNIGKPYVVLVFSRVSKKCVGWHVYIGNENWKEGYRLALFCALSSKQEHLRWLDIGAPDAWPENENLRPSRVYVDGGPGASTRSRDALERLNIDFHLAPPDTPYWKPTVEGGIGNQEARQSHLDGGIERTNNAVEKDSRRIAKLHANTDVWTFERRLVLEIIEYNAAVQKRMLLPAALKENLGPRNTPNAFHSAGIATMGGVDHRALLGADVYEQLLEHKSCIVTVNGVKLVSGRYNSELLRQFWLVDGKRQVQVFYDPLRPEKVYWRTPDGVVDVLQRDEASKLANGLASFYELASHAERMHALQLLEKNRKPRNTGVSGRQRDVLLDMADPGRKKVRARQSKNQELQRELEKQRQLDLRPYDRAEVYLDQPTHSQATVVGGEAHVDVESALAKLEKGGSFSGVATGSKPVSARDETIARLNRMLAESDDE